MGKTGAKDKEQSEKERQKDKDKFVLCPPNTHITSSVINAQIQTNAQFISLLGTYFIWNQLIERVCCRVL